MKIKATLLLTILSFSLLFTSCFNDDDSGIRTEADELIELTELIEKLEENYTVEQTSLGTYYIVHEQGEGEFPKAGDSLSIQYLGYFIDGTTFDSSFEKQDSIWKFMYLDPQMQLIDGMNDGLALMNTGSYYDLIIPSSLGYGDGNGVFPRYKTTVFSVKMKGIKKSAE
jgi:FKBP-type peptidyl-prolyl cis-trans isomerase